MEPTLSILNRIVLLKKCKTKTSRKIIYYSTNLVQAHVELQSYDRVTMGYMHWCFRKKCIFYVIVACILKEAPSTSPDKKQSNRKHLVTFMEYQKKTKTETFSEFIFHILYIYISLSFNTMQYRIKFFTFCHDVYVHKQWAV